VEGEGNLGVVKRRGKQKPRPGQGARVVGQKGARKKGPKAKNR